jgi:hypothetical protein
MLMPTLIPNPSPKKREGSLVKNLDVLPLLDGERAGVRGDPSEI